MKIPHPIPYQGSKRNIANMILQFFPTHVERLVEPFVGSAAISIASAYYYKADKFWLNDINEPLIKLWEEIINEPEYIIKRYYEIWTGQLGNEEKYYYQIRELFNSEPKSEYLLFLLAKCVKAAVRYNLKGEFNQSPDKRRKGRKPENMRSDILRVSQLLKNKVFLTSLDYNEIINETTKKDLVYLDPPYQGTGKSGGFKYLQNVKYEELVASLFVLNKKEVPFILSYDGRTGNKKFGKSLPENLNLTKIEIDAGRSSIATLHNREQKTFEALYISEVLANDINISKILNPTIKFQPTLFS